MDRKILTLLLPACLPVFFASCEKDANIPLPKQDPKLVVYSYICPEDTVIQVSVTASSPVFNSGSSYFSSVENASVMMVHNGSSYALHWDPAYSGYIIDTDVLPVDPGQTYELTVSAQGFETVSARTTVPQVRNWDFKVTYNNMREPNQQLGFNAEYFFNVKWNHFDNNDHYRISEHFYRIDTVFTGMPDTLTEDRNNDFYSSQQATGGIITDVVSATTAIHEIPYPYPYGFYYDLIISTYDYFKFHQSVNNYHSGDPFAEPTLVYSNMTNGYGIFAGYLKVTRRIDY